MSFGVYVHWPFCLSKCPYCDFNSHVSDGIDQARWRRALLAELAAGRLPRADVSAFHARQMRSFNDAALTAQLTKAWGELREAAADKRAFIAKLKTQLFDELEKSGALNVPLPRPAGEPLHDRKLPR